MNNSTVRSSHVDRRESPGSPYRRRIDAKTQLQGDTANGAAGL
jgi:hypothetical protein